MNGRNRAIAVLLFSCTCRHASATDRRNPEPASTPIQTSTPTQTSTPFPFGAPAPVVRYTCPTILTGGPFRAFLAAADTHVAFIDGNDLLALANRSPTGALPPTYAPSDLVDLRDGTGRSPSECESAHACLRSEAAIALHRMLDQMRVEGMHGHIQSAFRGFGTQCWVFAGWARQARGGFCEATEQSALPGHSQHQLGTTLDLFTSEWAEAGAKTGLGVFRNGFGCTQGGKWVDENAWRYGFVVPYPIDPDDRKDGSRCLPRWDRAIPVNPKTGYKSEPWHLRFIGIDAATRYHEAWLASEPGTPGEITLEQWLRAQRGLAGDAELPVCDGCSCGACATLAADGDKAPCGNASLRLDADGRVAAPVESAQLVDAHTLPTKDGAVLVEVTVRAPAHTPTQTPITTAEGPTYHEGDTFEALAPYPDSRPHRYGNLPGAWRVALEPLPPGPMRWPWRASLAKPELAAIWNRANVLLPAKAGDSIVRIRVYLPRGADGMNVALLHDGEERDVRQVSLP